MRRRSKAELLIPSQIVSQLLFVVHTTLWALSEDVRRKLDNVYRRNVLDRTAHTSSGQLPQEDRSFVAALLTLDCLRILEDKLLRAFDGDKLAVVMSSILTQRRQALPRINRIVARLRRQLGDLKQIPLDEAMLSKRAETHRYCIEALLPSINNMIMSTRTVFDFLWGAVARKSSFENSRLRETECARAVKESLRAQFGTAGGSYGEFRGELLALALSLEAVLGMLSYHSPDGHFSELHRRVRTVLKFDEILARTNTPD